MASTWAITQNARMYPDGEYIRTTRFPAKLLISQRHTLKQNSMYCLRFWYQIVPRKRQLSNRKEKISLYIFLKDKQAFDQPEWLVDSNYLDSTSSTLQKSIKTLRESIGWRQAEIVVHLKNDPLQFILSVQKHKHSSSSSSSPSSLSSSSSDSYQYNADDDSDDDNRKNEYRSGVALDDISLMEGQCHGAGCSDNLRLQIRFLCVGNSIYLKIREAIFGICLISNFQTISNL
ncbi:hypothetical protein HELRODRAFT_171637 [Helobdella robusta]|uniref:Uncharacterized protein n=1 Tax=Helobdella robusta TaxID=6412 RepID=T1F4H7_HELRO|nr:hypothetical protein HELRODRAFT_171637 [Helobdella robusta]ESO05278.1 hypothetical protein HELRODRAFT_171637 [Helobdella robusta]